MARVAPIPFSALVGQATMRRALLLNAVAPGIGGVLIRGEKGTAKSTAVRALAALLPEIEVVEGCRFGCDPNDVAHLCVECRIRAATSELPRLMQRMRVVELPINASEDRVVGAIDIEAAIRNGQRRFEPGLLAEAHRNILYVDEVNLLDDHIVDVLLDAAAMGTVTVEREGVSFSHPSRFILVGTMNPEEGDLRPQLLDRFGLCVDVSGLRNVDDRVNVMEQDATFLADPAAAAHAFDSQEQRLRDVIAGARDILGLVTTPRLLRKVASSICVDAAVVGHRADIVIDRTAAAIRAWADAERALDRVAEFSAADVAAATEVTLDDIVEAAELALVHRRRSLGAGGGEPVASVADSAHERFEEMQREAQSAVDSDTDVSADGDDAGDAGDAVAPTGGETAAASTEACGEGENQTAASALDPFAVRKIALPRDRRTRKRSGKRSQTQSGDRRGRYVAATQVEHTTDLAFDATVRAAAPYQVARRAADPTSTNALRVERQDLRQKVRRRRTGTLIVFVVDASASMDAEQRMEATKGAILSLLRDAYVRRDKVALVVFSGRSARVVLQPTSSIDLAESRLQRLGVGGTTPLTHGLLAGLKVIRSERLRDATVIPLMVLISDGRGNISLFGEEPVAEAQAAAEQIGSEEIRVLIIDSARDYTHPILPRIPGGAAMFGAYAFNACQDLAERSGGEYLGLYDLSQGAIVAGVQRSLRGR